MINDKCDNDKYDLILLTLLLIQQSTIINYIVS